MNGKGLRSVGSILSNQIAAGALMGALPGGLVGFFAASPGDRVGGFVRGALTGAALGSVAGWRAMKGAAAAGQAGQAFRVPVEVIG